VYLDVPQCAARSQPTRAGRFLMGYRTVFSVQDQAPADLTSGELAVILAVARSVKDDTGTGGVDEDTLCRRAKMTPRGVGKALQRLAERGYELRVPIGKDKHGAPVYAVRGQGRTYRIPHDWRPVDNPKERAYPSTAIREEKGRTAVPERAYPSTGKAVPQYAPGSQGSSGSQSVRAAVEYLCTEYGVVEEDGLVIWRRIQDTAPGVIRSPLKYAQRCVGENREKWHQAPAAGQRRQYDPACPYGCRFGFIEHLDADGRETKPPEICRCTNSAATG
jgi:hypothetical protein